MVYWDIIIGSNNNVFVRPAPALLVSLREQVHGIRAFNVPGVDRDVKEGRHARDNAETKQRRYARDLAADPLRNSSYDDRIHELAVCAKHWRPFLSYCWELYVKISHHMRTLSLRALNLILTTSLLQVPSI